MKGFIKKAFTVTEVILAMVVMATIVTLVATSIKNILPNQEKMRFKTAYYSFTSMVDSLINDGVLYPKHDFSDTSRVKIDGVVYEGNYKFFKALKSKMNILEEGFEIIIDSNHSYKCFTTNSNYTYCIKANLTETHSITGSGTFKKAELVYGTDSVRIILFTNFNQNDFEKFKKAENPQQYFDMNAYYFNVKNDGQISIQQNIQCYKVIKENADGSKEIEDINEEYAIRTTKKIKRSDFNQCRAQDFLNSDKINDYATEISETTGK